MILYYLHGLVERGVKMKKKNYPFGYKVVLFLAFQLSVLYGTYGVATVPSALESETQELSDGIFQALVKESEKRQERQEDVSTILNENNVIGVVFEKDDGSFCQISEQENPEDYIPSFMSVSDSLEDFGLSKCGEEELAALAQTAQVAAVDGGPSQAKVAMLPAVGALSKVVAAGVRATRAAGARVAQTQAVVVGVGATRAAGARVAQTRAVVVGVGAAKAVGAKGVGAAKAVGAKAAQIGPAKGTVISTAAGGVGYCVAGGVQGVLGAEKEKNMAYVQERAIRSQKVVSSGQIIGMIIGMVMGSSKRYSKPGAGRFLSPIGGATLGHFAGTVVSLAYVGCESGAIYFLDSDDDASVDSDNTL